MISSRMDEQRLQEETDRQGGVGRQAGGRPGNGCLTLNRVSLRAEEEETTLSEETERGLEGVYVGNEGIRDHDSGL